MILSTFEEPADLKAIKERANGAGLNINSKWNPSSTLARSGGLAVKLPAGWELTKLGRNQLVALGIGTGLLPDNEISKDLRKHLNGIARLETRAFVEEAIKCFEADLFRSAVVMSWIAAVDTLYAEIVNNKLAPFNVEASRVHVKWKAANSADDLSRMKEADFLDIIATIGVIGKNQKTELKKALDLRNGCGHPNSLKISRRIVAAHIEMLLLNVLEVFTI